MDGEWQGRDACLGRFRVRLSLTTLTRGGCTSSHQFSQERATTGPQRTSRDSFYQFIQNVAVCCFVKGKRHAARLHNICKCHELTTPLMICCFAAADGRWGAWLYGVVILRGTVTTTSHHKRGQISLYFQAVVGCQGDRVMNGNSKEEQAQHPTAAEITELPDGTNAAQFLTASSATIRSFRCPRHPRHHGLGSWI